MLEFQEKRKLKKFLYSKTVLAVLIIFIILTLNAVWGVYKKQAVTKDNFAKTASNLAELQARDKMLSSEIERLKTESGTEEEIREKYGLIKPGEEVITVVDRIDSTSSAAVSADAGFWQRIINWLR